MNQQLPRHTLHHAPPGEDVAMEVPRPDTHRTGALSKGNSSPIETIQASLKSGGLLNSMGLVTEEHPLAVEQASGVNAELAKRVSSAVELALVWFRAYPSAPEAADGLTQNTTLEQLQLLGRVSLGEAALPDGLLIPVAHRPARFDTESPAQPGLHVLEPGQAIAMLIRIQQARLRDQCI